MSPDHRPTPATIIGELLTSHPEAERLLAGASQRRALAKCSGVITRVKFAAAEGARLAYEELRHRLEPRRRHPVNFGAVLLLLLILSAGLAMLVLIELSGWLGSLRAGVPALAATAVWLTVAWLAVLTAGAAVLTAHVESPGLFQARLRWHRARAAYEEAAATQQADADAAAVAAAAWLGLVRTRVTAIAAGDERLVQDTVALAAVLIERGRPELPPSW